MEVLEWDAEVMEETGPGEEPVTMRVVASVDVLESDVSAGRLGRFATGSATLVTDPLKALFAHPLSVPGWTTRFNACASTPPLFSNVRSTSVLAGRSRVRVAEVPSNPVKRSGPSVGFDAMLT